MRLLAEHVNFSRVCFRGNSKYHYYGLRIKSGSPLLRLMDEQQHMAMRQQPFSQKTRYWCLATPTCVIAAIQTVAGSISYDTSMNGGFFCPLG